MGKTSVGFDAPERSLSERWWEGRKGETNGDGRFAGLDVDLREPGEIPEPGRDLRAGFGRGEEGQYLSDVVQKGSISERRCRTGGRGVYLDEVDFSTEP
jgi:hypothetical protein